MRFTRTAGGATDRPRGASRARPRPRAARARPGRTAVEECELLDATGPDARPGACSWPARPRRCCSARRCSTSACASCSTPCSTSRPPRRPRADADGEPRAARRAVQRVRLQGAGRHGQPPTATGWPSCGSCSGCVRARHGGHARRHRQAVRHEVRPAGVRPRPRDRRHGLPRRRRRPGQRHRAARRRQRSTSRQPVTYPPIPSFAPEHFAVCRARGLRALQAVPPGHRAARRRRAWCRCCASDLRGDQAPVLAAVGPMQFEVVEHRHGRRVRRAGRGSTGSPYRLARRTDAATGAGSSPASAASRCSSAATARCWRSSPTSGGCGCSAGQARALLEPLVAAQL